MGASSSSSIAGKMCTGAFYYTRGFTAIRQRVITVCIPNYKCSEMCKYARLRRVLHQLHLLSFALCEVQFGRNDEAAAR